MGVKKRLFPKKAEQKDQLIAKAKGHIRKLSIISKNYSRRSEISRKNAKIALTRGEKDRAKSYLVQYKQYQTKVDRTSNMKLKLERQIEAIQEGIMIQETGKIFGGIRDELADIATKASPVKIAEIAEDSEAYVAEIEESAEIIGGDPEIDLGIDISEELNQLETEMLLDKGGTMPDVPTGDLPSYISEVEMESDEPEIQSKEKLQKEIEKLRKELEG